MVVSKELTESRLAPESDEDTSRLLNSAPNDLEAGNVPAEPTKSSEESAANKKFLKNVSLALLAVQNCAMILSMKYSKTYIPAGGKRYLSTTAVVVVCQKKKCYVRSVQMILRCLAFFGCRVRFRSSSFVSLIYSTRRVVWADLAAKSKSK